MIQRTRELSRRDPVALAEPHVGLHQEEPAPVGTLFLMILFLAAIAAQWGTLYWMLLAR